MKQETIDMLALCSNADGITNEDYSKSLLKTSIINNDIDGISKALKITTAETNSILYGLRKLLSPSPKVHFIKIRDVHSPERANDMDAGSDWFIPNYSEDYIEAFRKENEPNIFSYSINCEYIDDDIIGNAYITIMPHCEVKFPSGIRVLIEDKHTFLQVTNKSGIATKKQLDVMPNTIDAGYTNELIFGLVNTSSRPQTVKCGQKIVQLIHRKYIETDFVEVNDAEYDKLVKMRVAETEREGKSFRGLNGFGSSGLEAKA